MNKRELLQRYISEKEILTHRISELEVLISSLQGGLEPLSAEPESKLRRGQLAEALRFWMEQLLAREPGLTIPELLEQLRAVQGAYADVLLLAKDQLRPMVHYMISGPMKNQLLSSEEEPKRYLFVENGFRQTPMRFIDEIVAVLRGHSPMCDDCIAAKVGENRSRQQVNQTCRKHDKMIHREVGTCCLCKAADKLVNSLVRDIET